MAYKSSNCYFYSGEANEKHPLSKVTNSKIIIFPTKINDGNDLTEFGLLSSAQFGFRKSHSTATALLDCTNEWYMNIDKKIFNLVVL